jgi:hypothetical protein
MPMSGCGSLAGNAAGKLECGGTQSAQRATALALEQTVP